MNLPNIPFELIFIVLFFVLPALSNLVNRRNRRPPDGPGGERPNTEAGRDRPDNRPETRPSSQMGETRTDRTRESADMGRRQMGPTSADSSAGDAGDTLRRRLEEAQRRVQEALGEEGGRRSQPPRSQPSRSSQSQPRTQSPSQPQARTQSQSQPRPQPQRTSRPGASQPRPESSYQARAYSSDRQTESAPKTFSDAPPLLVQRLGRRKRATTSKAARHLAFDETSIMQGFIWHQVLSPPRAKQPRRTHPSRR